MKQKSSRLLSVEILQNIVSGKGSLSTEFSRLTAEHPEAKLAVIREYCYGVCRWFHRLEFFAAQLLNKPLRNKDRDVYYLILLGLYQLFFMRTPDHAAVNETVSETRGLKKAWAGNLLNAILRQAQREREALEQSACNTESSRYSHPGWLIAAIKRDWPDNFPAILEANNTQGPMTLRLNLARCSRPAYLARLAQQDIAAVAGENSDTAVILEAPSDVNDIPGFSAGDVSVQDEASQLAARLLDPVPGARILDACAAPGGKTCAIEEREPRIHSLLALDNNAQRLQRVRENLERLQLEASLVCADAGKPESWWDGTPFDRILLDAPCSGTGVIRRHPDIKLLRGQDDIARLCDVQWRLLCALWPCLKSGGLLLYSTCSILREENETQINRFVSGQRDAVPITLSHPRAHPCTHGIQFLPGRDNLDGFYYALLQKC